MGVNVGIYAAAVIRKPHDRTNGDYKVSRLAYRSPPNFFCLVYTMTAFLQETISA